MAKQIRCDTSNRGNRYSADHRIASRVSHLGLELPALGPMCGCWPVVRDMRVVSIRTCSAGPFSSWWTSLGRNQRVRRR